MTPGTREPRGQYTYGTRVDPDTNADFGQARRRIKVPPRPTDRVAWASGVLGVAVGSPVAEVRRAVKRLVFTLHPDRGGDTVKFTEVLAARDVLLGSGKRGVS